MQTSQTRRSGFTLIELFVVVVIIGILASLLTVALVSGREAARRTTCINNQGNIAKAMLSYVSANDALPPLVTQKLGKQCSWVVTLLPYLGEEPRYKEYLDMPVGGIPNLNPLPFLLCPADRDKVDLKQCALSYIVNAGTPENLAGTSNGTNFDFYKMGADDSLFVQWGRGFKIDKIKRGASQTAMMTENLQATNNFWVTAVAPTGPSLQTVLNPVLTEIQTNVLPNASIPDAEKAKVYTFRGSLAATSVSPPIGGSIGGFGFWWTSFPDAYKPATPDGKEILRELCYYDVAQKRINAGRTDPANFPTIGMSSLDPPLSTAIPYGTTTESNFFYARPSSNHPGVVVVTYADGHVDTLKDTVEASVYLQMCDPCGQH
ncbi:MAG: DUF1559 domain-containing protein [Thermoguttaceae bacterium]